MSTSSIDRPPPPAKMLIQVDSIPPELREMHRWLVWDWVWSDKKQKYDKPPLRLNGKNGSSTDSTAWTSFEAALRGAENGFAGIGFALGIGIIGVDLDDCRDPATGRISEPAASIIRKLDTYTEISPSGTGVKLFLRGTIPPRTAKVNHAAGIEVYNDGRYFTITGHKLPDAPSTINQRQKQLDWLLAAFVKAPDGQREKQETDLRDPELARLALKGLRSHRAEGYWDWLRVGMALHSVSDDLLSDWDEWSRQSEKYVSGDCKDKWDTFSRSNNGVGLGTLIHWAKQDGWMPPRRKSGSNVNVHRSADKEEVEGGRPRQITNATIIEDDDGKQIIPKPIGEIVDEVFQACDGQPYRMGTTLFIHRGECRLDWLESPAQLLAYMGERTERPPQFLQHPSCVTKSELHAALRMHAREYKAVEVMPHEPPVSEHFYACQMPQSGDGTALRGLLGRFCPATDIDGDLILAMLATGAWGGPPGARPCFAIVADEGRGCGKSKLAQMVGELYGGVFDLAAGEDFGKFRERLLSPDGLLKRIVLFDNLKSLRFSWQELEALITSTTISGKRLYVGEASRPNLLTVIVTLNGPALASDMAQRSCVIKLAKPKRSGTWEEETRRYINENRAAIIADIVAFLRSPRGELAQFSRWASWELDVLSCLPEPADAQKVILERQQIIDVEGEEAGILEEFFADQLGRLHYSPDADQVFIPSAIAGRWFNWAHNDQQKVGAVSRIIGQLIDEERIHRLRRNVCRSWGRGFVWHGAGSDVNEAIKTDIETRLAHREGQKRG